MDIEDRIREAVREDRWPEPSVQFHSWVMASLPDRAGKGHLALPALLAFMRVAPLALVAAIAIVAAGLPLMLSRPGANVSTPTPTSAASLPSSGTFTLTGSMAIARANHTATLLPDGRVLIAGGSNNSGDLASAELYDPTSGTFSPTGSMDTALELGTATLLPDGRVLIAGGIHGSGVLASAELYDPTSGTFSPTGSMATARVSTATLLPDGRVLIAGGAAIGKGGAYETLASAELYDPSTGKFSLTGSLTTPRWTATATLLPDGRVLVAGGGNDSKSLASADLYEP
jgi:WD40 repeat protein